MKLYVLTSELDKNLKTSEDLNHFDYLLKKLVSKQRLTSTWHTIAVMRKIN